MKAVIRIILIFVLTLFFTQNIYSQEIIRLEKVNGIYKIPCLVNGIPMSFIFDTGASNVSISLTEALFLLKQGLLTNDNIKQEVKYKLANGKIEEGTKIIIKEITIEDVVLKNVEATVVNDLHAPLLFGVNAISQLGQVVIKENYLVIYSKNNHTNLNAKKYILDSTFYKRSMNAYKELFKCLKTKNPQTLIENYNDVFSGGPDSVIDSKEAEMTSDFNVSSKQNELKKKKNKLRSEFNRLYLFGIKQGLSWSNIKSEDLKFSVNNGNLIVTFKYTNDFYVMSSWLYSFDLPSNFVSLKAYIYNDNYKNFLQEIDRKKIEGKDYFDKIVDYTETSYGDLSKNDIQYLNFFYTREQALSARAKYRFSKGDYSEAIRDWNEIIGLPDSKKFPGAYFNRGWCKMALEDYRGAILDFNKYLLLDSKNLYKEVYSLRADSKLQLKMYKEALSDYNSAIRIDANDSRAFYNRAIIKYFQLNDKNSACDDWSKAGELGLEKAYKMINAYCK